MSEKNKDKTFFVGTIVPSSLLKDATKNLENVKQPYFFNFRTIYINTILF